MNTINKAVWVGALYIPIKWVTIPTIGACLYNNGHWNNWYFLLIPSIGLILFKQLGKRFFTTATVPSYSGIFNNTIEKYYPANASKIQQEVFGHYMEVSKDTRFALRSKNPIDRRLDFCSYFLALIKTLDQRNENFEMIRQVCLEVVTEYVRPTNKLQAYIKKLIPTLIHTWLAQQLIQKLGKKVSKNDNPEGFIANIITAKEETFGLGYGVDILECGICKLFQKHSYSKYASILCEVDEITSGLAGLKLIRTGTIANGANKCDFRFIKETS
ncbi:L-2-amino-thiazoline-4-carboxylic acid hydrolase [Rhodocytophaga rosea]|uniref:L-2-amino-thiazoline-4-carboxylic acid hydrolase n=1 Tax=Rhodocytophaga rosea TaxID=2704465 RepID=A0A6C0GH78_9BACT|nr:L-2-amino-thiazoline-4-carboxylic acid hydrolase [Rhodocytophaga rosea]QHT67245.1 L-2-amino-thiazoline-4-carboxylic acid hydrolase [Rhodocytophaga rosea]